jgi:GST-like protein
VITLFTAATGNGYRASILLEELDLAYRVRLIDFARGEHRSEAFLAVNPRGKIPVLVDEDGPAGSPITVAESLAIALYLSEKTGRLQPVTLRGRAMAWSWGAAVISGFGAAFTDIFYSRSLDAEAHAPMIDKAFADLRFQFAAMDDHLGSHPYLAGEAFTWIDGLAIPLVGTAARFDIDLSGLSSLQRWSAAVLARPAVQRGLAVGAVAAA